MDAIKAINKEADFWMQMYEEASVQREKAVNAARNYRRRAAKAESDCRKLRKTMTALGFAVVAGLNILYYYMMMTGRW